MSSQITWINSDAFRSLSDGLAVSKPRPQRLSPLAAGLKVLRASGQGQPPLSAILGGSLPLPESERVLPFPEFKAPALPLTQRLNSLLDWLSKSVRCSKIFLSDADGLPLAQRNCNVEMIGLCAIMSDAARQLAALAGVGRGEALHIDLENGAVFHLIELSTGQQVVALGIQTRSGLTPEEVAQISSAVLATLAEQQRPAPAPAPDIALLGGGGQGGIIPDPLGKPRAI